MNTIGRRKREGNVRVCQRSMGEGRRVNIPPTTPGGGLLVFLLSSLLFDDWFLSFLVSSELVVHRAPCDAAVS